jgi:hypothetical protein
MAERPLAFRSAASAILASGVDMGRKYVEAIRKTERASDFICHFRIKKAREKLPSASVRTLAETKCETLSMVFFRLSEVIGLKFRYLRWIIHLCNGAQETEQVRQSFSPHPNLSQSEAGLTFRLATTPEFTEQIH